MSAPSPEPVLDVQGEVALVVVDMQHSFFELPGLAEQRAVVVAKVNELIAAAREASRPVVLVRTQHEPDGSTWTLTMLDDQQGFAFPGSEQARFLDELDTRAHIEIVKTRNSAFHHTHLEEELRRLGVTWVLLCGVSTHSCVMQTATDAFAHDFRAAVAVDAVASEDPTLSEAMLEFLRTEQRQPLLHQTEALTLLRG